MKINQKWSNNGKTGPNGETTEKHAGNQRPTYNSDIHLDMTRSELGA